VIISPGSRAGSLPGRTFSPRRSVNVLVDYRLARFLSSNGIRLECPLAAKLHLKPGPLQRGLLGQVNCTSTQRH